MTAEPRSHPADRQDLPPPSERGSVSIEAVMIIPAFLLFLALIVAVARVGSVQADVHAAAVEGARVGSLQDSAAAAEEAARRAIDAHLARENVHCVSQSVAIEASSLDQPPGTPGSVTVTITCLVPLGDLGVPGLPGEVEIRASFSTAIDTYSHR